MFKKYVTLVLCLFLLLCGGVVVYAAVGDEVYFYGEPTSHDVTVNGENKTIYCLQNDYIWPVYGNSTDRTPTKYVEADASHYLLNEEQLKVLQRLMFAGYPYNAEGIFDDLYAYFEPGDDTSYVDMLAANITQQAVWYYTGEWGIAGNTPDNLDELDDFFYDHVIQLIEFAATDTPVALPDSAVVQIEGSPEFSMQGGVLKTGALKITKPVNYRLRYHLELPTGITAVDKNGYDITSIMENEVFYLVAADESFITDAPELKVSTTAVCPTTLTHYMTDDTNGHPTDPKPYQSMLCVDVESMDLAGTLSLEQEKYGDLVVEKLVTADSATYAGSTEFDFQVTLTGPDVTNQTYKVAIYNVSADGSRHHASDINVDCVSGVLSFKLKANQEAEILDIPAGTQYAVSETEAGGWKATYRDKTGTIVEGEDVYSTVTNTFEFAPVTASITLYKELVDGSSVRQSLTAGLFAFEMTPGYAEHYPGHGELSPLPGGVASLTATNSAGDASNLGTVTFSGLSFNKPGTYKYIVVEKEVTQPDIERDRTYYEVTVPVTVGAGNTLQVGTITYKKHPAGGTSVEVTAADALFTNRQISAETDFDFTVLKEMNNKSGDSLVSEAGYKFEIAPADSTVTYPNFGATGEASCIITTDENGVAISPEIKITTTMFESMFGSSATEGVLKYTISEVPGSTPGVSYSDKVVNVVVKITKSGSDLSTAITFDGSADYPIYVNEYTAAGTAQLKVDKTFHPTDYVPAVGEKYAFSVYDDTTTTYGDITIEWDGSKWVQTGGEVTIKEAGLHEFFIAEKDVDKANMHKDHTVWTATVLASENATPNGTLNIDAITYTKPNSDSVDKPTFVNTYAPSVVRPDIHIAKELVGREWSDHDLFHVTISFAYTADTNPQGFDPLKNIDHTHNELLEKDGFTFHKQELVQTGTYYYVIKETKGDDPEMTYDGRTFIVKYVVTKDGNDLKISAPEITVIDGNTTTTATAVKFVNTVGAKEDTSAKTNGVNTGDTTPIALYVGIILATIMVMALALIKRKNDNA